MAGPAPRPIHELSPPGDLVGVLCDIDDTLTVEGKLVPGVLDVMVRARAAGLRIVPITGRPGGWVDQIARMWPVDGVVGENGGLWFWMDERRMERRFLQPPDVRAANRDRLTALGARILEAVPGTALASDQPYRDLDLAIDFCEDVPALPEEAIDRIQAEFAAAGATSKVSSIHVNGWFGHFERFHADRWGTPPDMERWAFFGDSANDAPMFGAFNLSIGVANVRAFLPRIDTPPKWITSGNGGHGFIEGMAALGVP
jgi:hypothetical protein